MTVQVEFPETSMDLVKLKMIAAGVGYEVEKDRDCYLLFKRKTEGNFFTREYFKESICNIRFEKNDVFYLAFGVPILNKQIADTISEMTGKSVIMNITEDSPRLRYSSYPY